MGGSGPLNFVREKCWMASGHGELDHCRKENKFWDYHNPECVLDEDAAGSDWHCFSFCIC